VIQASGFPRGFVLYLLYQSISYMKQPLDPRNFAHLFFAGRSRITLVNTKRETHIRLKIKEKRERVNGKLVGTGRFYLYTSILNDGDTGWQYAAVFFKDTYRYRLGADHQQGSQIHRVTQFVYDALKSPEILTQKGVDLHHEGRCCRCAMPLTHPDSIQLGVGPDCIHHMPESFFIDLVQGKLTLV